MRKTARSLCTAFAIAAATLAATAAMSGAHANEAVVFDTERLRAWGEIENLAWPLQVAAADQCKDPSYHTGIELLASPGQGFFVRNVSQGSPAHGLLEVEDRVIALDGHRFAQDPMQAYEIWIGGMRADLLASDETQRWTVLRNDVEHTVEIEPTKVCHLEIFYVDGAAPAVLRRQNMAMFTPQIRDIAPEPWMLQAQIAHDLGHRLGQHEEKRGRTSRLTGIAGNLIGAIGGPNLGGAAGHALNFRRAPAQEVAADQAGIDLAVSIGLSEADLIQYWVDLLDQTASGGGLATWLSAHPAHHSRIEALETRFSKLAQQARPADGSPAG